MFGRALGVLAVPLEVPEAVVEVAVGVAGEAAEQVAVEIAAGPFGGSLERCHLVGLVDDIKRDDHVGEGERGVPGAGDVGKRRLADGSVAEQGALAQGFDLAAGVVDLRGEEEFDLVEAVGDFLEPLADDFLLGDAVGGVDGAELAGGALDFGREFGQAAPIEVGGGDPAVADGVLVEEAGVVGPDLGAVVDRVAGRHVQAGHRAGAARGVVLQVPNLGHLAVGADVDIGEAHAVGPRGWA